MTRKCASLGLVIVTELKAACDAAYLSVRTPVVPRKWHEDELLTYVNLAIGAKYAVIPTSCKALVPSAWNWGKRVPCGGEDHIGIDEY
jgi:hypothetical protein